MSLLAGGISDVQKIIVIVLCIAVAVFLLSDVILVISLHRKNKKLVKSEDEQTCENKEENK